MTVKNNEQTKKKKIVEEKKITSVNILRYQYLKAQERVDNGEYKTFAEYARAAFEHFEKTRYNTPSQ